MKFAALNRFSADELQQEMLQRAIKRTVEALDRAQATVEALQVKHLRRSQEARRLARRIAAARKEAP